LMKFKRLESQNVQMCFGINCLVSQLNLVDILSKWQYNIHIQFDNGAKNGTQFW
jgi:hypothetical protein